ncbi:MAG: aminoacyl-tRNA hydrolase [Bdellovibrio sp. CG10_big_fil_rev_8_21_14_0_10_47_8]|nr:MAG: aminoacyl-tRNA hydrolase [Bdellovibrio sp. CG10_big_fil_rev_8_21_14_0_10_47_8]
MFLVVGLGNPGAKYALTRHNIGFMAVDLFAMSAGNPPWKEEHKALTCRFQMDDQTILLAKPMTYMNKSGESVQSLMQFYKIEMNHLLVVQDDIDQALGMMRFHQNRGHGGHNGIRSISELLGSADYARLKLGVGRPPHPDMEVADYVLQKFSAEEQSKLPDFLNKAGDALESLIFEGLQIASTKFNGR